MQGFSQAELEAIVEGAAAAWVTGGPCTFGIEVVKDPAADDWYQAGGVAVLFGDPNDELPDGIFDALLRGPAPRTTFERNGASFHEAAAAEVVLNDGDFWTTDADIDAGECSGQYSLRAQLTHELGHVLGLDDACGAGAACSDQDAPAATMYWALKACDTGPSTLGTDDIDGLTAIYGAGFPFGFSCSAAEDDGLTVRCAATEPSDIGTLSPTWDFGDGAAAEGAEASHTYASRGTYDIELCIQPPDCGGPRCQPQTFVATPAAPAPSHDTANADDAADTGTEAGCGCAAEGRSAASSSGIGVALAALLRRRRR